MTELLKGKTAVITGGSRGIGKAACIKLAENGADIAFIYASNDESASALVTELEAMGTKSKAYKCDVANFDEVSAVFTDIIKDFGGVNILVNSAGITRDKLMLAMKPDEFRQVIDINLCGAFNVTKQVYPLMLKNRSGKIINISSVSGLTGNAGQTNYSASKAGLIGFTKSLAKELASRGICCNAIAPGFVETDMTTAFADNEKVLSAIPMHRFAHPGEVAELILFLASPMSDYITGEVIRIDGGLAI